jgi:hypothetical protein
MLKKPGQQGRKELGHRGVQGEYVGVSKRLRTQLEGFFSILPSVGVEGDLKMILRLRPRLR